MRKRLTYANVVATLALVFAMSGGALAASHYLVNSTKQINPKVLKKLKGATGNAGATGAAGKDGAPGKEGAPGVEGKTGPSEAIMAQSAAGITFTEAAEELLHVSLNPGSYTASATTTAASTKNGPEAAECNLRVGSTVLGKASTELATGLKGSLALSGAFTIAAGGELKLLCKASGDLGTFETPTLIATKVGSLEDEI
jgi:hypothetical protein